MTILKNLSIRIDPLFWLLAFGLGFYYSGTFGGMLTWAAIVFTSVLIHELGHALTAQSFGHEANITLTFFGGVTKRDGPPLAKWKEFLIVLNGPVAGILLAFAALWLTSFPVIKQNSLLLNALSITYLVNFFWTFINLFPIQPLDGGHLLMILCQGLFGYRGIKIALFISALLATLLGFFFFIFHQVFLGALFFMFAFDNFRNWRNSLLLTSIDSDDRLKEDMKEAEKLTDSGSLSEAKIKLEEILQSHLSKKGMVFLKASLLLAKIYSLEERWDDAYALLMPYKKVLDIEGLQLLHQVAYKSHHNQEALEIGTLLHQEMANSETALINALAAAELQNPQATIGWLKTAIHEGVAHPQILLKNPSFAFIQNLPEFKKLLNL